MVPRPIFNRRNNGTSKALVLVYIFIGGFTFGAKNSFGPFGGSSAGLLESSHITSPDGLIYVAINFRVSRHGPLSILFNIGVRLLLIYYFSLVLLVGCLVTSTLPKEVLLRLAFMISGWRSNGYNKIFTFLGATWSVLLSWESLREVALHLYR